MQDFTYKKVLKPRDCIHLELLVAHGSQLEVEKTHIDNNEKWLLNEETTGKKGIKLCSGIIWSGGK